jgi:crossover junction endodeoxyribonuclease RusA
VLILPWPAPALNPNARACWQVRHRIGSKLRAECALLTRAARITVPDGLIAVHLTAHPMSARSMDRDNLMARCKALLDGVADGLGVNDARFRPTIEIGETRRPPCIAVTIGRCE